MWDLRKIRLVWGGPREELEWGSNGVGVCLWIRKDEVKEERGLPLKKSLPVLMVRPGGALSPRGTFRAGQMFRTWLSRVANYRHPVARPEESRVAGGSGKEVSRPQGKNRWLGGPFLYCIDFGGQKKFEWEGFGVCCDVFLRKVGARGVPGKRKARERRGPGAGG